MDTKQLVSGVIGGVLVLVVGFVMLGIGQDGQNGRPGRDGSDGATGAFPGPDVYQNVIFHEDIIEGGSRSTTTTGSAVTLTTAELTEKVNYLSITPNTDVTITTMASTAAPFSNLKVGDSMDLLLYNASTSASATFTLAAGTGVDLQEDEGATVVVNGLEVARLTFVKKVNTDVIGYLEVGQVGD